MTAQVLEDQPLPPAGKGPALVCVWGGGGGGDCGRRNPGAGERPAAALASPPACGARLSEAAIDDTCLWSWCQGPGALLGWFC